jgi:GTP pyrophosphokinase
VSAKPKLVDTTAKQHTDLVATARELARTRLGGVARGDGQDAFEHAHAVAAILQHAGAPPALEAAAYLVDIARADAQAQIGSRFGASVASLVEGALRLEALEGTVRGAGDGAAAALGGSVARTERLRRMLLAFSRDLRGVLLHLASRLQEMRWHAQRGIAYPAPLAREAMDLLAPLANRLGAWSLKWELEDLAFRSLEPQAFVDLTRKLDATRDARLREVDRFRDQVAELVSRAGIDAQVQGRAKHLTSIWRKMQGKQLDFERVLDVRALRVVVGTVADCYAALSRLQERWRAVQGEFDDYIARPKPNGYQSLHTVLLDDDGRAVEVQIRTRAMHEHAELGVAAHWAYKEAGPRGHAGVSVAADDAKRVQGARKAMLHQLLEWERDVASGDAAAAPPDRVYVFTPQGAVVDLPYGATAIDFAYAVHTSLGHRCRGAKIDGVLVPLNTPLANGQTIEVTTVKEGGPSLDWLNPELHYLASPRSKAKVRAWFNAQAHETTVAQGRERLERLLQRIGRTAVKHAEIASKLELPDAEALYAALGKDDVTLRDVEHLWQAPPALPDADEALARRLEQPPSRLESAHEGRGDVLVVGVDSLLTGLARCCRPAPPDPIGGFVTRHKGVAIHRRSCTNFQHMAEQAPQRVIAVEWNASPARASPGHESRFAIDLAIEAIDRAGLLRDVTEVLAKEKLNVVGAHTQTVRDARGSFAHMLFTVEVARTDALDRVLAVIAKVPGVRGVRRK